MHMAELSHNALCKLGGLLLSEEQMHCSSLSVSALDKSRPAHPQSPGIKPTLCPLQEH